MKQKHLVKRILAMMLVVALVLGAVPLDGLVVTVRAAEAKTVTYIDYRAMEVILC